MFTVDVTPLSLGIETLGGVFTKLIEKIPQSQQQESIFQLLTITNPLYTQSFSGERQIAARQQITWSVRSVGIPCA